MSAQAQQGENVELDDRERRAAVESMVVDREGPGLFRVYSGTRGNYLVDAVEGVCECPDSQYRGVTCKHQIRVAYLLGERDVPEGVRADPSIEAQRRRGF